MEDCHADLESQSDVGRLFEHFSRRLIWRDEVINQFLKGVDQTLEEIDE
jgi:hypothetical protein